MDVWEVINARFLLVSLLLVERLSAYSYEDYGEPCASKLLLDVDTGVDDAMAIALAGTSPDVCVEAITVVAGNADLSTVYKNTLRVLEVIGRTDIPVYKGADRPIDGFWEPEKHYFGKDNFGNVAHLYPMGSNSAPDPKKHGYLKMMELIKNCPEKSLSLVMLGPLTNLAIVLLVEPRLTKRVNAIYILGGTIHAQGNIIPGSEFNFLSDPEAALVVLQRAQCPVFIIPWETILASTLPWSVYEDVACKSDPLSKFLRDINNHTVHKGMKTEDVYSGFSVGDFLAVLYALDPESASETIEHRVSVELCGTHTRGEMVHAWISHMLPEVKRHVTIVMSFDTSIVERYFRRTFNPPELVEVASGA